MDVKKLVQDIPSFVCRVAGLRLGECFFVILLTQQQ